MTSFDLLFFYTDSIYTNTALIKKNGVAQKYVTKPFWSDSIC